jgi:PAS domain S-box-containing protein
MNLSGDVLSVINALPDAVLIVRRTGGRVVAANEAFLRLSGFSGEALADRPVFSLPFFTKATRRGLLRLSVHAARGEAKKENFSFNFLSSDQTVKNFSVRGERVLSGGEKIILFTFHEVSPETAAETETESLQGCLGLGYEPYMEFRAADVLLPPPGLEDRLGFLKKLGSSLRVKFANDSALKLYKNERVGLEGAKFVSFFHREDDALRILDMLSIVGSLKTETTVKAGDSLVQVELNCAVKFDGEGAVAALYTCHRNMTQDLKYKAILGGSRTEMEFMFNQPFVGFAYLAPRRPLEYPQADGTDESLDEMLNQILLVRANQVMLDLYGADKTRFIMRPMTDLFPSAVMAREVLKELFVVRTSSVGLPASPSGAGAKGKSGKTVLFKALFDDANRLSGVLAAASTHGEGIPVRHDEFHMSAQ